MESTVFKHILIATDGSELAEKGIEQGILLAKSLAGRVTVVTVSEPWTATVSADMVTAIPIEEYDASMAADAEKILTAARAKATAAAVSCTTRHIKDRDPAEGIIEAANQDGCDLIVMASHGRKGIQRLLLGSQANRVVTMSHVPVLICR